MWYMSSLEENDHQHFRGICWLLWLDKNFFYYFNLRKCLIGKEELTEIRSDRMYIKIKALRSSLDSFWIQLTRQGKVGF
jgi:hypothetical protein